MHCKNCDYPLWNLTSRACPECGDPFKPSDFEFVPNSVRFCCPHCEQEYYGTNTRGHLVPLHFNCVSCRKPIQMDEMVLRPAEGVDESQTKQFVMPWLNRHKRSRIKAWFSTVGNALSMPFRLMQVTPAESSIGQAWWFAIVTAIPTIIFGLFPFFCLFGFPLFMGTFSGAQNRSSLSGFFVILIVALVALVIQLVVMLLWGVVTHLLLHFSGGSTYSIGRTYQAICYSSGANTISGIPCVGYWIGFFWWIISAVMMVKEAQKVSGLRASFATLTLPLTVMISVVGLYAWMMYTVSTMVMGAASIVTSPTINTGNVTNYIINYAANNNGNGPVHAVQLLQDTAMLPDEFVSYGTYTQLNDVTLSDTSLEYYYSMNPEMQDKLCNAVAGDMTENVVAHRVGDFVFTYHGIDLNNADPGLWIVVLCEDPDVLAIHSNWQGLSQVEIGLADGSVTTLSKNALVEALEQQNELRKLEGLPPLTDPLVITQNAPVTAEQENTDNSDDDS